MRHIQALIPAAFSAIFRVFVYLFLQVIPSPILAIILPIAFSAWLITAWMLPSPSEHKEVSDNKGRTAAVYVESDDIVLNILLSLPSSSRRVRWINSAINIALLLAVAEFLCTPFLDSASDVVFTRVGAVYPDNVKVIARYPPIDNMTQSIRIVWREAPKSGSPSDKEISWNDGPLFNFDENHDWVDVVRIKGLWPNSHYEYSLATTNGTLLPYPSTPIKFHTFPDPRLPNGNKFSFLVSSCMTTNFPYLPFQGRRIKGYDILSDLLYPKESASSPTNGTDVSGNKTLAKERSILPEFLLFLGDFIYADVPIYTGSTLEDYRRLYRRNYQSSSFRKIYERLPIFHTYDDHEILNNYAGDGDDLKPPFPNASDAFEIYNANSNYDPIHESHYYYDFRYGDSAFFVMDTRRYRSSAIDDLNARGMLGEAQLAAFYNWLSKANETAIFKFVVTSVPFTTLWGHDAATDSWAGFPAERASILQAMHSVPNVIILSGDRHEFAAIEYNHESLHTVREFSTSPLSMFYIPFYRTLKMQGAEVITRIKHKLNMTGEGPEYITVEEQIPAESVFKYIPSGNYKWSTIEVDSTDLEKPVLRVKLTIDGKTAYSYTLDGTPVKIHSSTALGIFVSTGIKDVFNKFGIHPSKWF
ncbi:PhoD-like phosphatase-domain-containing protein [Desarmillaria tabescens]|uniref:PhoD-like phosphatase-domain-containing protein n=1 Tax=Armillaria tabescens TaxID=1929756 RepID=A0AA39KE38_ARMTA|nr:PhoD-like phosphatase-domain-containing protein [Desarmillaria tabescens]KAK0459471.1 PhoD-like phosphatase-domain-containing protein [Desarmillaria tabescens]